MKLLAFGDSFTTGEWDKVCHSDASYVARLCEIKDSVFDSWDNYARGGYSNMQIAFSIYKYLQENTNNCTDIFFLIGWTSHARYSIANVRHEDTRKVYVAHDAYDFVGDPARYPRSSNLLIYETDMAILAIHTLLQQTNVPFAMIQAFDDHTNHPWSVIKDLPNWINGDKPANTLMHIVADRYLDACSDTLPPNSQYFEYNWISTLTPNQYIASCWHPNEQGHALIAKTLYPYLKHRISLSTPKKCPNTDS